VSQAASNRVLQSVGVQVGPDATIRSISSSIAVKDESGKLTGQKTDLDPAENARDLPVRVQTAYWLGNETGTDLAAIRGRSGQVVIEVTVQDLTATAQEIAFESDGAKYRQYALVGVPLTVVATTNLGKVDLDTVLTGSSVGARDSRVTDGVISETSAGQLTVQWATLLAPPMLSPTATFTLVLDTTDFVPPTFDITVQPGLVTDPSLERLLTTSLGPTGDAARLETSTIRLILDVNAQVVEAQNFVASVHEALVRDAANLGAETYRELEASSAIILAHLEETVNRIQAIGETATSQIQSSQSNLEANLQHLLNVLNQDVLGSPDHTPAFTDEVVAGCGITTLPALAPGESSTLSSTVQLVQQQLGVVIATLEAQTIDPADPLSPAPNCRTIMLEKLETDIWAECTANPNSVRCSIDTAQATLNASLSDIVLLESTMQSLFTDLGVSNLATLVQSLTSTIDTLISGLSTVNAASAGLPAAFASLSTQIGAIKTVVANLLTTEVSAILTATDPTGPIAVAAQDLRDAAALQLSTINSYAASMSFPTGQWFNASGIATEIQAEMDATCSMFGTTLPTVSNAADAAIIQAALAGVATDLPCPASGLAQAATAMATQYESTVSQYETALSNIRAQTSTANIDAHLDAIVGPLDTVRTTAEGVASTLRGLYDPADPNNTSALLNQIQASLSTNIQNPVQTLRVGLAGLQTTLQGLRPNDVTAAGAGVCPFDTYPTLASLPTADLDALVWLSNRLNCIDANLTSTLSDWIDSVQASYDTVDDELADAVKQSQSAMTAAQGSISSLSDNLIISLAGDGGVVSTMGGNLDRIRVARTDTETTLQGILLQFATSADSLVVDMTTSLNQANADSEAARVALAQDFANVLADLGSPDSTGRDGLLGKLRGVAGQVGDTADVLTSVSQTTTSYSNVQSTELRSINLRAAQFAAAELRLSELPPFPGAPPGLDVFTVYSFHVSGR
jgi:hypothetical protein